MATLQSPGVSVTVIDESFYTPAGAGTVPMIFVATGQDKANGSGTGIAQGTTAANAGKVWVITSQRDLTDTFGTPYFETDAEGNSVHGSELNEYGLQAAYSLLGVSSKAYIVRGDVDTGGLVASAIAPTGNPVAGTYWISTDTTKFGINEWNSSTGKFTVKTPLIIDNSNMDDEEVYTGSAPASGFGTVGNYAVVLTSDNTNTTFYKTSNGTWTEVKYGFDGGKKVVLAPHYDYPNFTNTGTGALNASTGSIWIKTTTPSNGAAWDVRYFNGTKSQWTSASANLYPSTQAAIQKLDPVGGGNKIALGTVIVEYDYEHGAPYNASANYKVWIRYKNSPTTISLSSTASSAVGAFTIKETLATGAWSSAATITLTQITDKLGKQISDKIQQNSSLVNVNSSWDAATNRLTITHALGGDIVFEQTTNQPLVDVGFSGSVANLTTASTYDSYDFIASNWKPLVYEAQATAPVTTPADGTQWFDSGLDVDILYNTGTAWSGYLNALPATDPLGPTVAASAPTTQQDGSSALVNGDIWVDTSNPDMYGKNIYVYDGSAWVLQDVTDHDTPDGWVFGDARWASSTSTNATMASIASLLSSNYVDPDCPDPRLYPRGTRLWNTRRSGNNVKQYHAGYIDVNSTNPRQGDESMDSYAPDRWVTASPNDLNNVGQFGRLAQRSVVVKSLKAMVTSNQAIRDTDTLNFNLIAAPGYPELMQNMVEFNVDNGQTAVIIGDTPFRLEPTGTALTAYGKNTSLEADNNDAAAVTYSTELAMFYPSGFTNDNMGNNIVVPPSHMMMRTIVNSDNKSYLWFAPAGTRRGTVDNASSVGYLNENGEYKTVSLHQGLRDVLQDPAVAINPIATLPGVGLVNMGQRTRAQNASALDRINVSRLIAYLRRQLAILAKPYLFEPNDSQTRHEVKAAVDALLTELVSQRALYDFLVVCDSSNNTPARIDRSELWVDIAIEPVKAVEFIYIPLRIMNTGEIAAGSK
jgi:hypothetical protein